MIMPDAATEYGTWSDPHSSFRVIYSLPLLQEIDLVVTEGYRLIPHGGIELGGLLFGHSESGSVRLETFRPIQCEHAMGPSFKLSERDLTTLREQISSAHKDAELTDLAMVGWFISHTRSPLQMNDMEAALFQELLPGPNKLTLLIKPEKFKATLFAFLPRSHDGNASRDGTQRAIILPLPGRAGKGVVAESAPRPVQPAAIAPEITETVVPPVVPPLQKIIHLATVSAAAPAVPKGDLSLKITDKSVTDLPERVAPKTLPMEISPELPAFLMPPRGEGFDALAGNGQLPRAVRVEVSRSKFQFATIMFLAAALGCGLGYWAYLQLPPAVIQLNVQPQPAGLTVSWPREQVSEDVQAALRINDSLPVPLSSAAKLAGRWEIQSEGDDVKVELIARHWMRDSRGIVRYVRPVRDIPESQPLNQK